MSGICGIVRLDGAPVAAGELAPMLALLERRGPDGTGQWQGTGVALGHTNLATTPEAVVERLPLTHSPSGCTITADVRLDNREDLIPALGLGGEQRVIGDGELILHAYLKWGEDCPKHLLGDFAFAIWDERHRKLFCARDHMGMRQLVYSHAPGKAFVFATEPRAVVAHPDVPRSLNEARVADFLLDLEGLDHTSTFFEDVLRLPPAHTLSLDAMGLAVERYWQLQAPPELHLASDAEYEEAFRAVFTKAVECRLRTAGPVGAMLSGGVDSASVAVTAARLLKQQGRGPLHTISAVGPDPEDCPETYNIRAMGALSGIAFHEISHAALGDDAAVLAGLVDEIDEPFDGHLNLIRAVYLTASRIGGTNVVLDGVAADVILTGGNVIARLLAKGKLVAAMREARAFRNYWGENPPPTWHFLFDALRRLPLPRPARTLWRWCTVRPDEAQGPQLLDAAFAERVSIKNRLADYHAHWTRHSPRLADQRLNTVLHPHLVAARERYDRVAAFFALEPRDPFLDKRVVEFCLSLPWRQVQSGGWPKLILRRAMAHALPACVVWKRGKHHLGRSFTKPITFSVAKDNSVLASIRMELAPFVSKEALEDLRLGNADDDALAQFADFYYMMTCLESF